jgi:hypothetical protein
MRQVMYLGGDLPGESCVPERRIPFFQQVRFPRGDARVCLIDDGIEFELYC